MEMVHPEPNEVLRIHNTVHLFQNAVGRKLQQPEAGAIMR